MAFKSIDNTFIYKHLNSSGQLTRSVAAALKEGIQIKRENIEEALIIINKNFKYPLKVRVLDAFERGDIVLLYSPHTVKVPTTMPFFLTKNASGKVIAVVMVDLHGKLNPETKTVNIDAKKLYCLMESALLALTYFHHADQISKRSAVVTNGSAIYASMFTRVLNKKYALNIDKTKMQKVIFLSGKFFLVNVLGMNEGEMTFNYASRNCVNANPLSLHEMDEMVTGEDLKDLSTFLQALTRPELNIGLSGLQVRSYLEQYIVMYDAAALLALESFPYFMYNIISVLNAAYLNNQYVLEDIVDKQGAKLYADLLDFNR